MIPNQTALILIGYQNDYFAQDGILHQFIEESSALGVLVVISYSEQDARTTWL